MRLIRKRGVVSVCTVALAVVFAAAMVGCSQQRDSGPGGKQAASCGSCHAKCAKAGDKPCGKACPKGCTKPCCAKAAGKPVNEKCPITGKPVAEGVTTTCCGMTVGFCCKDCIEQWNKLSCQEKCKKLGCEQKCKGDCKGGCKGKCKEKCKKQAA